jgi:hypothetical protein
MWRRVSAEVMRRSRLLSGTKALAGRKSTAEMSIPYTKNDQNQKN